MKAELERNKRCIYCKEEKRLTKSHIIPESMGGSNPPNDLVCKDCNDKIGRTIEADVSKALSFYRFILQLKSKGKVAKTRAEMELLGQRIKVFVGERGLPIYVKPIRDKNQVVISAATPEKLKEEIKKYRNDNIEFKDENIKKNVVKLIFPGEKIPLKSSSFIRFAAKVAFESFCDCRIQHTHYPEYDQLRDYIKDGKKAPEESIFLFFDNRILTRILAMPFPIHGILLYGTDNGYFALVILFGLFAYFIKINQNALILQDWEYFCYYDPVSKEKRRPIRQSSYDISIIHRRMLAALQRSGRVIEKEANEYARKKFQIFMSRPVVHTRRS